MPLPEALERLETLLDAMAHEFKTPLTSVMAATSALLANPEQPAENKTELIKIADEEAKHEFSRMGKQDRASGHAAWRAFLMSRSATLMPLQPSNLYCLP